MSKTIEIIKDTVLASAGLAHRKFLHLVERTFTVDGEERKWWIASRREQPPHHADSKPDAVIICAILENDGEPNKMVLTSEFRLPLGDREIGFPAGLIDADETAEEAAIREFREETGLELEVSHVSPPNLYSSAGMTDESVQIVFGRASGTPSQELLEKNEDIEVILADAEYVRSLVNNEHPELAYGAKAWCLMHGFAATGF